MKNFIENYIQNSIETKKSILENKEIITTIHQAVCAITNAYNNGNKVITAGNGGSAADAEHIAGELVSKFNFEREALNAIALTTNASVLTAIGNDYNNDYIFARQIQAYGKKGDIFFAISTSGNSKNIIKAIEEAKHKEVTTIGLCGKNESKMDSLCDILIKVPSTKTSIIQESQIMIGHIICALVEKVIFEDKKN